MLQTLLGSGTAARLLLHLLHHGETYPGEASRHLRIPVSQLNQQLSKFRAAGIVSVRQGDDHRLVYYFTPRVKAIRKLKELLQVFFDQMTPEERERLLSIPRGGGGAKGGSTARRTTRSRTARR